MANTSNNFLKGKMNKDLDARLLQNGEYRNAINASVSKSEGSNVGALENVLGNSLVTDFNTLTDSKDESLKSIGYLTDEINNTVYVFLTDNAGAAYSTTTNKHYIISYNALQGPTSAVVLVTGAFLNFSQLNPIYGVNILESLLFWTDNRNQPRKINVVSADSSTNYYTTEEQLSVAKYNPYESIEFFQEITAAMVTANPLLGPAVNDYQTTMFDVSSKFYPNGGAAISTASNPLLNATSQVSLNSTTTEGDISLGDKIYYIDINGVLIDTTRVVDGFLPSVAAPSFTANANIAAYDAGDVKLEFIFNANPYYKDSFSGDSEFLKDKFVRFSYRFQFDDNEYSIFAPFTQPAFIPEQDGYFMYTGSGGSQVNPIFPENLRDEEDTYRSTIVDFMENKVTKIDLRIPLPATKAQLFNKFKVTSIDILYKESDALAVKVVDTITRATIEAAADQSSSILTYEYNSKKPFKTLPSDEIIRVFDKVPVRAFSQEISANRVIYGNFQTKHTPPEAIDYSVNVAEKEDNTATITPRTVGSNVGKLEYPSSTLKQNRTYQVGIVLSDKFGRQSTVVLSNQDSTVQSGNSNFGGSTTFTSYLSDTVDKAEFPGNALRVLFNQPIGPDAPNSSTGWPGIYNGDVTNASYNPLGWFSYKIVVKQQEQEYYNVYLPGVMAAYPNDKTLEIGKTSHTVLINDNINKVPRDLNEVGPTQKQFRSSVNLNGRVENENRIPTSANQTNKQFYPTKAGDIVSTIASDDDLFNGENILLNFIPSQAFYSIDSNPFIARISTTKKFGVINDNITRNAAASVSDLESILLNNSNGIVVGDAVTGSNIIPGTIVVTITNSTTIVVNKKQTLTSGTVLNFHKGIPIRNLQNLAVFETDPVLSELDIFWETSSTGLITDLNTAIIDSGSATASLFGFNSDNFTEAIVPGYSASNVNPNLGSAFTLRNQAGADYPYGTDTGEAVVTLVSVFDTRDPAQDRSDEFVLNDTNTVGTDSTYTVGVKGNAANPYYYYGFPLEARSFRFLFRSVINSIVQEFQEDVTLINVIPSITGCPGSTVTPTGGNGSAFSTVATLDAVNGSAYGLNKQTDLTWTLTQPAGTNYFNIAVSTVLTSAGNNALRAVITVNTLGGDPPNGDYDLKVAVKDAGNLAAACIFTVTIAVAVCNFIKASQANPVPDYDFAGGEDAAGNPQRYNVSYQNCSGVATVDNLLADGAIYCTQALGTSVAWALVNPPAGRTPATGVFNLVADNCGPS